MVIETFNLFADGHPIVQASTGTPIALVSPWSAEAAGTINPAGKEGVDTAVAGARRAYLAHRAAPAADRIAWLQAAASEIEKAADRIIESAVRVIGKPRRAARFEVQRSAQFVRACAAHLVSFGGDAIPLDVSKPGAGLFGFAQRVPYGVIGAITPFNAPSNLLLQKVAPALATGNAIVVKPAPEGTPIAFILAECFTKAGLPAGLFNIVAGGVEEAQALAGHADVSFVTITGGTMAGRALAAAAGAKPFVGELGGNSANIVCADANLADAAARIVPSAFEASGQQCISAQRIIVEESVIDRFMPLFVERTRTLVVGDPAREETDVGPVVHERAAKRIMEVIAQAEDAGATIVMAPKREDCIISPVIIQSADPELRIVKEEIFGPVAVVIPAKDVGHAIRLANESEFGLQASCFTSSLNTAFRMSREIQAGSVWINEGSRFRLDNYPFGGVGSSGYGREGVSYAMETFTQWKFTGMRFPDRAEITG